MLVISCGNKSGHLRPPVKSRRVRGESKMNDSWSNGNSYRSCRFGRIRDAFYYDVV
jgi:hypothetical protein